ncbi:hypothetical protein FSP39_005977 [Pinctada imbricata]|uniref:Mab-21-like HhH/H2TH-like domain-containing protein n=1 Tax=Pinctada imbricata TaxID=66713 RepID=A0AA88XNA7_PINIB|nr:hypothetical protein FSP39_005977 [Pinctada imbricata]
MTQAQQRHEGQTDGDNDTSSTETRRQLISSASSEGIAECIVGTLSIRTVLLLPSLVSKMNMGGYFSNHSEEPGSDVDELRKSSVSEFDTLDNNEEIQIPKNTLFDTSAQTSRQHEDELGTQSTNNNQWRTEFVIFTEDEEIPAGCCRLVAYDTDGNHFVPSKSDAWKFLRVDDIFHRSVEKEVTLVDRQGFKCLPSRYVMESKEGLTGYSWLNMILPTWLPHGPAFKQTYFGLFEIDVIECFHCKTLPDVLCKWAHRERNHWPSIHTIQIALSQGCHVVALPSKISADDLGELEWRFGYGKMEKVLMDSLSDVQKQCFILLKIILKEYIDPTFPDEDILSSFIMKMLIFWMAEETEGDIWTPSNLLHCLNLCMKRLNEWVQSENCPNYFIPEYNLFRTKKERMEKAELAKWFQKCVELEWRILLECKSTKRIVKQHFYRN